MADGYARETGRLGVCLSTSGPGATNLITGVACAYSNHVPILAITGQPALPSFGRGALQESTCTGVNIVAMFGHCTRYNSLVSHADQVETKVIQAILRALSSPQGPAHLSFPVDILRTPVLSKSPTYDLSTLVRHQPSLIDERTVAALASAIFGSSRIVFLIGEGSAEAIDSLMTLVQLTGALFITTPDAKGLINPFHPAYRGVFGLAGHMSAYRALLDRPDLVVAFGTGFGEFASSGWSRALLNDRLVHVDESEENLLRTPMARLHVLGRMRAICDKLVAAWKEKSGDIDPPSRVRKARSDGGGVTLQSPEKYHSDASPIKPQRLMKELSHRFPPSTRFLADAGNSMMWAPHYLQPVNRRGMGGDAAPVDALPCRRSRTSSWLRVTLEFAPMGWAIGAAVGVARGNPRCPVVCITGDGSYLMSGQEITTAAEEELPVIFVILNDHAYGMVMHGQRLAGAERIAYELPRVDFRTMAGSMAIPGYAVEHPGEFERIDWEEMVSRKGPTLLDVRIDREEVPPMTMRLKTLGSVAWEREGGVGERDTGE
jgi:acetolactate synthase-1/2/3 large subunit